MTTEIERVALLQAAKTGDEEAFKKLVACFDGLIWRTFTEQNLRQQPDDWYQECRIVMFRCLMRLETEHWGVLTNYFRRALFHHRTSLWRSEFKRATATPLAEEAASYDIEAPQLAPGHRVEWADLVQCVYDSLNPRQQRLLRLWLAGYTMQECAKALDRSPSWCYQNWQLIQKYFKFFRR
ncbi:RNA polymerase sigma factor [Weissella halotolerans]|uniref:RNA polymerase sigma-70 ECF-like HTH domain-containing protein n=1 Tax=Weissella halotolerans DSM 20190 TaxID=1123500 RepID=A0A0R2G523_9LACO|nr:ECF-type sigma factor [Weissella halotolerans]KRN32364.1 hypothetical protein IV68_GL000715 [Weissella halotolerans DSM 20190]